MSTTIEQIKEKLSIEEVVGGYVKLDHSGANLKGRCPFHNEKTPSFYVSPDRGSYYCFGCNAKGDIFTFVQEFEGLDFMGALRVLAERAGVEISAPTANADKGEKEKIFEILEEATNLFQKGLKSDQSAEKYLKDRGVTDSSIESFRLGYVKDDWRVLYDHFTSRGIKEDILIKAGLIKETLRDGRKTYYDTFRGRITFPLFDSAGRVIAFSGRSFPPVEKEGVPKYLNSPESIIFHKSKVLFGFDRAKTVIKKNDYAILVEGQMDLVMCHQAGFVNAVATSGTSLTEDHLKSIMRFSHNLMMAFDADSAGLRASERAVKMALSLGMAVKVVPLPKGKDPADLIKEDVEKWRESIKKSSHIIDFYTDTLVADNLSDRDLGKKVQEHVLPFVRKISSSIEQSAFIKSIAYKTGIREQSLWEDSQKVVEEKENITRRPEIENEKAPFSRLGSIEKRIVGIIKWQEKDEKPKIDTKFLREELKRIAKDDYENRFGFMDKVEDEDLILEVQFLYSEAGLVESAIRELLNSLEEEYLKKEFSLAMENLARAEKEGDKVKRDMLLGECKNISSRINEIKKISAADAASR